MTEAQGPVVCLSCGKRYAQRFPSCIYCSAPRPGAEGASAPSEEGRSLNVPWPLIVLALLAAAGIAWWRHYLSKDYWRETDTPVLVVNASPEPTLSFFVGDVEVAHDVPQIGREWGSTGARRVKLRGGRHTLLARAADGREVGRAELTVGDDFHGAVFAPRAIADTCFALQIDYYGPDAATAKRDGWMLGPEADLWRMPEHVDTWLGDNPDTILTRGGSGFRRGLRLYECARENQLRLGRPLVPTRP